MQRTTMTWLWFLRTLHSIIEKYVPQFLELQLTNLTILTLLSDRQKGLIDGVACSSHGHCLLRLKDNFHKSFRKRHEQPQLRNNWRKIKPAAITYCRCQRHSTSQLDDIESSVTARWHMKFGCHRYFKNKLLSLTWRIAVVVNGKWLVSLVNMRLLVQSLSVVPRIQKHTPIFRLLSFRSINKSPSSR